MKVYYCEAEIKVCASSTRDAQAVEIGQTRQKSFVFYECILRQTPRKGGGKGVGKMSNNGSRATEMNLIVPAFGRCVYSCWPRVVFVDDLQTW